MCAPFISILFGPLCTKFMRCVLYHLRQTAFSFTFSSKCVVFADMKIVGFHISAISGQLLHTRCTLTHIPLAYAFGVRKSKRNERKSDTSTIRKSDPRIKIPYHQHRTLSASEQLPFLKRYPQHSIFCNILFICVVIATSRCSFCPPPPASMLLASSLFGRLRAFK